MNLLKIDDTICAIATGGNESAIAVIRVTGDNAIKFTNSIFSKNLINVSSHSIHYGDIIENNEIIDEVLVSVFKKNNSFTGEETTEISCHGSIYIQEKIIQSLLSSGCRLAKAGEFSMRAFKNGKIDLSQAESIADLISSKSKAEQQVAIQQLKGGVSNQLKILRTQLIDFASLIELELDFSEEDVEFADRNKLKNLLYDIKNEIELLIDSFKTGNAIKNGIPVTIIGSPNAGKSTLLNSLLNEDKAIVSEIAGTTRDIIEDKLIINGVMFRFIDTAGIRKTDNKIENIGIDKAIENMNKSNIIIQLIDSTDNVDKQIKKLNKLSNNSIASKIIAINKIDIKNNTSVDKAIYLSAKKNIGIDTLKEKLIELSSINKLSNQTTIITNTRHLQELKKTREEVNLIIGALDNNISSEFIASNIREALNHLGSITGNITNDTLLKNIFSKFCIGK
ncbi:MAG: tRNA uridine-5-carboxymethylaminomethyl(34) synthesis GTPase MnmE [Flavobacteriales bacterium]|nr:tRNA uridine-5-carboxymethylaminomethyl(34) synthesis GTPase MnmE [Flavobacteriales bacterium]